MHFVFFTFSRKSLETNFGWEHMLIIFCASSTQKNNKCQQLWEQCTVPALHFLFVFFSKVNNKWFFSSADPLKLVIINIIIIMLIIMAAPASRHEAGSWPAAAGGDARQLVPAFHLAICRRWWRMVTNTYTTPDHLPQAVTNSSWYLHSTWLVSISFMGHYQSSPGHNWTGNA